MTIQQSTRRALALGGAVIIAICAVFLVTRSEGGGEGVGFDSCRSALGAGYAAYRASDSVAYDDAMQRVAEYC